MNRQKYVESIQKLDKKSFLSFIFGSKKQLLENLHLFEEQNHERVDTIWDRTHKDIHQSQENNGEGIFKIELGTANKAYITMLRDINPSIHIQIGDPIVGLHINALAKCNNPHMLSTKELFVSGFQRLQEKISKTDPMPKYITFFSHLAPGMSQRYPSFFKNYDVKYHYQTRTSSHRYVFGDDAYHTEQSLQEQRDRYKETNDAVEKKWIEERIAIDEAYVSMKKKGIGTKDISLAIGDVESFMKIDFSNHV